MYEEDRWFRRRMGAGALLLLFLLGALALPLWLTRGNDHPLAGVASMDLCLPLRDLHYLRQFEAHANPQAGAVGSCSWFESRESGRQLYAEASLMTVRSQSPQDLGQLFDNWHAETKASRADELSMTGESGQRVLFYRRQGVREWLVEDHGTLLWLRVLNLDPSLSEVIMRDAVARLRTAPAPPPD